MLVLPHSMYLYVGLDQKNSNKKQYPRLKGGKTQRPIDLHYISHKQMHDWIQTVYWPLFHQECTSHNILFQLNFMFPKLSSDQVYRKGMSFLHLNNQLCWKARVSWVGWASNKCISVTCNHKSILHCFSFPLWIWSFSVVFWCSRKSPSEHRSQFIDYFRTDKKQNCMMQTSQFDRH